MKTTDEYARLAEGAIEMAKKSSAADALIAVGQVYATLAVAASVHPAPEVSP